MATDYLQTWGSDWESRSDPELLPQAWRLREQGWSHAEIAGQLGVSVALAYRLTAAARKYERTPDPDATIGHLMTTVIFNLSHANSHSQKALDSQGATRQFNLEHLDKHLKEAISHMEHLAEVVHDTYPKVGKEFDIIADDLESY